MHDLEISWPGGTSRFSPEDSPVRVGRSSAADIVLEHPSVSRLHLELTWSDHSWVVEDRSTHGTFDPIGVRLTTAWKVGSEVDVRLGGVAGDEVHMRPISRGALSRLPVDNAESDGDDEIDRTVIDVRPPPQPAAPPLPNGDVPVGPSPVAPPVPGRPRPSGPEARPNGPAPAPILTDHRDPSGPGAEVERGSERRSILDQSAPSAPAASPAPPARPIVGYEGLNDPAPASAGYASTAARDLDAPYSSPAATSIQQGSLHLSIDGHDFSFGPETTVTIGRDPACLVRVDERHTLVSRRHLQIVHDDGAWWLEDHSSKGTFVNGRPIRSPYKAEGAFVAYLGDDDAGTPLKIITAGEHRAPRNYTVPVAIGLGLAVLALMTWLVMAVLGEDDGAPNFEQAKRSSVILIGEDGIGSGFFIENDLIVTNQHVAAISDRMFVGVTRDIDEPAVIEYVAETVAFHPYLDIAVMKIVSRAELADGTAVVTDEAVGDVSLPVAEIGDSDKVTLGDEIYSVGFPQQFWYAGPDSLPTAAPFVGEATAFDIWPGCDNPAWKSYIPEDEPSGVTCAIDGDIRRGQMIATMTTGRGASGSAVYSHGSVVGVVFAGDDTPNKALTIATSSFAGWLDEVVAAN